MPHRHLGALVGLLLTATLVALPTTASAAPAERATEASCDVRLRPGQDLPRAVRAADRGAVVCLSRGTYPMTTPMRPRRGQVVVARGRVVLDGSRVLRGFERTRTGWVVGGQRQQGVRNGTCLPRVPTCALPDDVLLDGRPLRRVLSRAALGPGRYFFDYRRDRIHLGSDPRGHVVRALVARAAVASRPGGSDVTVRGLVVQRFASQAQHGAVQTLEPGWRVERTTVRDNHGAGITTVGGARVVGNRVLRNGQLGIGGAGPDIAVTGNHVEGNGGGGYDPAWEAGGAKWAVTTGLRVERNTVVGNHGPGLWTDIDAQDTTYVGNVVRRNRGPGIFHEISAAALIADNVVERNGHGTATWLWGSGILVAGSHHVEVARNRLAGNAMGIGLVQQDRGSSEVDGQPRRLHDVAVHDNVVRTGGGESGMVQDDDRPEVFDDPTITWTGNTWLELAATPFHWDDEYLSLAQWRALGHDLP